MKRGCNPHRVVDCGECRERRRAYDRERSRGRVRLRFMLRGKLTDRVAWVLIFATSPPELAFALATRRKIRKDGHASIVARFGLTPNDYARMVATQAGRCAICARPEIAMRDGLPIRLSVDHDHETGRVRGLLCGRCNTQLGAYELVRSDPRFLAYLAEARAEAM